MSIILESQEKFGPYKKAWEQIINETEQGKRDPKDYLTLVYLESIAKDIQEIANAAQDGVIYVKNEPLG